MPRRPNAALDAKAGAIEILVTGTSHAQNGVAPQFFDLPAFNLGYGSQSLHYYLRDERFTTEDFFNIDHLNRRGAEKFSRILNEDVVKRYVGDEVLDLGREKRPRTFLSSARVDN